MNRRPVRPAALSIIAMILGRETKGNALPN